MSTFRIMIDWTRKEKFLQYLEGKFRVEKTEKDKTFPSHYDFRLHLAGTVEVRQNSVSYHTIATPYESEVNFDLIKPVLDTMVRSYFRGFLLEDDTFNWVELKKGYSARVI